MSEPTGTARPLRVSVVAPVRNERDNLPRLLRCVEEQTRRPDEVVVVDGRSDDGSREWLHDAAATRPWLHVVDNPERIIPIALNLGLARATGDVVARMDAHADYAPTYLERVVAVLETRPDVVGVGGAMSTEGRGPWGRAFASVLRRPLGLGGAPHRVGATAGPVDHVFSGAYRREALLAVGGYDPSFLANEDFEADHRLRLADGVIWLTPDARCTWFTRDDPHSLARQMFRYGYFKARTLRLHPASLRLRQLAPPALLVGVTTLALVRPVAGAGALAAYIAVAAAAGAAAGRADAASPWRAGAAVPVVHVSWGAGLLAGAVAHRRARPQTSPAM